MSKRRKHQGLIRACEGDVEFVKQNINGEDIDIHCQDPRNGTTILHAICEHTNLELFQLVASKIQKIDNLNHNGQSAIYSAIQGNQKDILQALLEMSASLDIIDKNGQTPIEYAVTNGSNEIAKLFISKQELFSGKDNVNLLNLSIKIKDVEKMKELLANDIIHTVDSTGRSPILYSITMGDFQTTKLLLNSGANVRDYDKSSRNVLVTAAFRCDLNVDYDYDEIYEYRPDKLTDSEHIEIMKLILEQWDCINSVDVNGWSALHYAIYNNNFAVTNFLISQNCDLSIQTTSKVDWIPEASTPLTVAILSNNTDLVRCLLKAGVNCNSETIHPLHLSVTKGNLNMSSLLVENGANVNTLYYNGDPILHRVMATKMNNSTGDKEKLLTSILDHEYDFNLTDSDGNTGWHAIFSFFGLDKYRNNRCMHLFRSREITVNNLQNKDGETVLMLALKTCIHIGNYTCIPLVDVVMNQVDKAQLDLLDNEGNTLLHYALMAFEVCTYRQSFRSQLQNLATKLLDLGADITVKNKRNETPFQFMMRSKTLYHWQDDPNKTQLQFYNRCILPNQTDTKGISMLHKAVCKENYKIVKSILYKPNYHSEEYVNAIVPQTSISFKFQKFTGLTTLQIAIKNYRNAFDTIPYLIKCGCNVHMDLKSGETLTKHLHRVAIYNYVNSPQWFYSLFLLIFSGAAYRRYTLSPVQNNMWNRLEKHLLKKKSCTTLLRRAARAGYIFNTTYLETVDWKNDPEVLHVINLSKNVYSLEVLSARTLRQNLYPNAWVAGKKLALPQSVYSEHFEIFQQTLSPTYI